MKNWNHQHPPTNNIHGYNRRGNNYTIKSMANMPKNVIGLIWHCLHGNTLLQWVSVAVRRNVQKLGSAKTCAPYAFPFTWGVSSNCSKQMHFWFTATRRSANAATANPPAMFIFPDKLFSYQHKLAKPLQRTRLPLHPSLREIFNVSSRTGEKCITFNHMADGGRPTMPEN